MNLFDRWKSVIVQFIGYKTQCDGIFYLTIFNQSLIVVEVCGFLPAVTLHRRSGSQGKNAGAGNCFPGGSSGNSAQAGRDLSKTGHDLVAGSYMASKPSSSIAALRGSYPAGRRLAVPKPQPPKRAPDDAAVRPA